MRKNKVVFVAIAGVLYLFLMTVCVAFAADEKDFVGKPVSAFVAKDLDGKDIDIKSFKGKNTVLINFWGLRCGSCIEEMPHLNKIYDTYKDKGLVILGVNADSADGEFLKSPKGMVNLPLTINYTVVQDPEGKLIDLFKMEQAPLNILIDKDGNVQFYHMGYEAGDEKVLEEKVKSVIK